MNISSRDGVLFSTSIAFLGGYHKIKKILLKYMQIPRKKLHISGIRDHI